MYNPAAVACMFIILLVSTAGCSILSTTPNTTGKQGIAGEASIADLPPLPEQYVAPPLGTPHAGPAVTTPTLRERLLLIVPEQKTTINGTGLSGTGTNSSTTGTSTGNSSASVPVAQFTTTTALGYAPFIVQFMDSSLNTPVSWSWDFGDNSYSFLQNPSHTYTTWGQYRVVLTAANAAGSSSFSSNISVFAPGFSVSPDHGAAPLSVTFTDVSSGYPHPTAWLWDFGDGSTCPSQNKIHTYILPGTYDVKLRISGPAGTVWVNRTAAVMVT
jgi:PKD repeat protein